MLLLRRYGQANKLHSFQELFGALEGDHLRGRVVSMAPGTALACTALHPPDAPALGAAKGQGPSLNVCFFRGV